MAGSKNGANFLNIPLGNFLLNLFKLCLLSSDVLELAMRSLLTKSVNIRLTFIMAAVLRVVNVSNWVQALYFV